MNEQGPVTKGVNVITTRIRLSSAALILAAGVAFVFPATAMAAASPARPATTASGTGTAPGTDTDCTPISAGTGEAFPNGGGSTVVWWITSCGDRIQERSWCKNADGTGFWSTSGIVSSNGVQDGSTCPASTTITRGEDHVNDGNGWGPYSTFWTN
jgi:hypothetical protein